MTLRSKLIPSFMMLLTAGAVAFACGGETPPAQAPAGSSASAAPSAAAAPASAKQWKDMDHGERLAFMQHDVFVKMKSEFSAYDSKYANMNCATCHGDGAKDGSFKMPNPKLPVLPASKEGFQKLQQEHPEAMKFMGEKVVPQMAQLLGEEPFDMKTMKGFGCGECHTREKQ